MAKEIKKLSGLPHEDYTLAQIDEGYRYRKEYGDLARLKATIMDKTLIQAIAVCRNPDGSSHPVRLVAGGRRFRALQELVADGRLEDRFTCRVLPEMDDLYLRTLELMENAERESMTFLEDAKLKDEITRLEQLKFGKKIGRSPDAPGHSLADTAKLLNVSASQVQADARLLKEINAIGDKVDWSKFTTRSDVQRVIKQVKTIGKRTVGAAAAKKVIGETANERVLTLANSYRIEDCTLGMKAIASGTQDFVEIDPPYAIALHEAKRKMQDNYDSYNEVPADQYIKLMRAVFDEAWRIMKPDSWMICWFGPEPWAEVMHYLLEGGTAESAQALYDNLQNTGQCKALVPFSPRSSGARFRTHRMCGIWAKEQGQTRQPNTRFGNCYEMFYYVRKGNPEFNTPGKNNIFKFPAVPPQQKVHATERPAALISTLLDVFVPAGSYVTVPFAGSGRTLLEAAKLDMIPIGFDLCKENKDSYIIQLNKELGAK